MRNPEALADTTNSDGTFSVSLIPPGRYVVCYAYADEASVPKLDEGANISLSPEAKIEAGYEHGKWVLISDAISATHTISKGSEISTVSGRMMLKHAAVRHNPTGLWMEFEDGAPRFVSIEANKVSDVKITALGR